MDLTNLLAIANYPTRVLTLDEVVQKYGLLDEAFIGRKPIRDIQSAMDKLYARCVNNSGFIARGSSEANALDDAFTRTFGFRDFSIYWRAPDLAHANIFTIPQMRVLHLGPGGGPVQGQNSNGFYDSNHSMCVAISTEQAIFTEAGVTSEEMVAILLHEIGHNFDYTFFSIMRNFIVLFESIISIFLVVPNFKGIFNGFRVNLRKEPDFLEIAAPVVVEWFPKETVVIENWDDLVLSLIPSARTIANKAWRFAGAIMRLMSALMFPVHLL